MATMRPAEASYAEFRKIVSMVAQSDSVLSQAIRKPRMGWGLLGTLERRLAHLSGMTAKQVAEYANRKANILFSYIDEGSTTGVIRSSIWEGKIPKETAMKNYSQFLQAGDRPWKNGPARLSVAPGTDPRQKVDAVISNLRGSSLQDIRTVYYDWVMKQST